MKTELITIVLYAFWFVSEAFALQTRAARGGVDTGRGMVVLGAANILLPLQALSLHILEIGDARLGNSLMAIGGALMVISAARHWHRIGTAKKIPEGSVAASNEHSSSGSEFQWLTRHPGFLGSLSAFAGLGMSLAE